MTTPTTPTPPNDPRPLPWVQVPTQRTEPFEQQPPIVPPHWAPPAGLEHPYPSRPPQAAKTFDSLALITLFGGALTALGSFMPWVNISAPFVSLTKSGMEADGRITLILGLISIGIGIARLATRTPVAVQLIPVLPGLFTTLIASLDLADTQARMASIPHLGTYVYASVGGGMYAVLIGGILTLVGGFAVRRPTKPQHLPPALRQVQ